MEHPPTISVVLPVAPAVLTELLRRMAASASAGHACPVLIVTLAVAR